MSKKDLSVSATVGVRELKNQTSAILRRLKDQHTLVVTDRRRPVAILLSVASVNESDLLVSLVEAGRIAWSGGKPAGAERPARVRGPSVSDAVIEDRR
ncbi:MAG: type II toxin-antitoxin system prevent-host-death family antitoxin [Deltaproteobacteria bacterium]|nr:type II toxin-antitoxin system prevent-host-death family antitoxin [Deltaproteobacteria bacterium]